MKNDLRLLTREEAALVDRAAEHWLRVRDVEFNAGEEAVRLLVAMALRRADCTRRDIATLGRRLVLRPARAPATLSYTLVRPEEEDLHRARVSLLSDLGLASIGHVVGGRVELPSGGATLVAIADEGAPSQSLTASTPRKSFLPMASPRARSRS